MRSTQQMSITLPIEMAAWVKAKVAAGEYATESEVIRDGLRALLARDRAMDDWLRDEVMPVAASLEIDPGRALSAEQVREHMAAKRQRKGTEPR
ncbi:type II toxin-antitoxin system ParD family antitoxin [Pseudomonas sp. S09G 359]|uniref:ribbon-helix-helix domain-containing protein n=1 Tax=Pseudomonas sp. S09G 359 TaxID=2054919 RepID=UPI003531EC65